MRQPEYPGHKPQNIEEVLVHGTTYRMIYESHGTPHMADEFADLQGCGIEAGYYDYRDDECAEWDANSVCLGDYKLDPATFRAKGLPIYLIDIFDAGYVADTERHQGIVDKFNRDNYRNANEAELALLCYGAAAVVLARRLVSQAKKITRREFLLSTGLSVAGLLNSQEFVDSVNSRLHDNDGNRLAVGWEKAAAEFIRILSHERIWVVTLRNMIWAQKLLFMREYFKKDRVGMVLGAYHYGLKDALQMSDEQRAAIIQDCILASNLNREPVYLSHIAVLEPNGDGKYISNSKFFMPYNRLWTVTEHLEEPVLKKIQDTYWPKKAL